MTTSGYVIEQLRLPASGADVWALAEVLMDAVESGAAVSFMATLTMDTAVRWWEKTLSGAPERGVVLVAREGGVGGMIVGTVQIQPAWAPNQPHRAEVVKLLVHRRAQGAGLGRRLMEAIEDAAWRSGFSLLTLDAKRGGVAEHLYRRLGWTHAGTIPRYAYDADGAGLHDTVIYYRECPTRRADGVRAATAR